MFTILGVSRFALTVLEGPQKRLADFSLAKLDNVRGQLLTRALLDALSGSTTWLNWDVIRPI